MKIQEYITIKEKISGFNFLKLIIGLDIKKKGFFKNEKFIISYNYDNKEIVFKSKFRIFKITCDNTNTHESTLYKILHKKNYNRIRFEQDFDNWDIETPYLFLCKYKKIEEIIK